MTLLALREVKKNAKGDILSSGIEHMTNSIDSAEARLKKLLPKQENKRFHFELCRVLEGISVGYEIFSCISDLTKWRDSLARTELKKLFENERIRLLELGEGVKSEFKN